ncbi:MAG: transcription elongation factor GreA, partial [Nitrospinaceae bacterium]|nr:transcription elongation factor GreA [Nitrospinaceae bacterium]
MSNSVPMTPGGYQTLQDELKNLIRVERPKVVQDIAEARGHGDLSENAEYDAAKERQGMIEGRIQEINDKIARAQVIDPADLDSEKIVFGATVT